MKEEVEIRNLTVYNKEELANLMAKCVYRHLLEESRSGKDIRDLYEGFDPGASQKQGRLLVFPTSKMP